MYKIDFKNNHFIISIKLDEFIDHQDYLSLVNYLKSKKLYYSQELEGFKVDKKQIEEILLWFERDTIEFIPTVEALDKIDQLQKDKYKKELQIYRSRSASDDFYSQVLNENESVFNFQKEDINWAVKRNCYIDANDAGVGKTASTILTFSHAYINGFIDSIFIIVPAGLSYHWKHEILKFTNLFKEEDIFIINNDNKKRVFDTIQNEKIIIVPNYLLPDVVISYKKLTKAQREKKGRRSNKSERWKVDNFFDLKKLWNKQSIFCVIDESHEISNNSAIRTKCIMSLKDYFSYRVCLSATPNINHFEAIYTQVKFCDQSIIPMEYDAFRVWLAEGFDKYNQVVSYKEENVKQILENIKPIFRKRLKEDLPEMKHRRHIEEFYLELNPLQKQLYQIVATKELEHLQEEYDIVTWKVLFDNFHLIMEVFENPLLLRERYYNDEQLNKLLDKYKIEDDPKYQFLLTKLESIIDNEDGKCIIYDYRPLTLNLLYKQLEKYNPLMIHGSMRIKDKEKDRKEKEYLFNTESKHKVMLLSSHTSSQGINLNKMCNYTIYYNVPWNTIEVRQGFDRTLRINNTMDSYVLLPYYVNTVENIKVQTALQRIEFNDRMGKEIIQEDLERLLKGKV